MPVLTQSKVQTIRLAADGVVLLDQTKLPARVEFCTVTTVSQMVNAIQTMVVRGAPAIGIAGAFGVVLSGRTHLLAQSHNPLHWLQAVLADADILAQSRPTAVNLQWAIDRLKAFLHNHANEDVPELLRLLEAEAQAIYDEDLAMCQAIGEYGADLMPKGARILTHCNAGALATAGYGTALGVVRSAFRRDPTITVIADETRPRLQGARLTTWELTQDGISTTLITDNMSAWLMQQNGVDAVIVGADRIAANGDTANKIGTYLLALAARAHNIPFYVAAPSSTIDAALPTGEAIPIERRHGAEITQIHDVAISAEGVQTWNPAFDVTPAHLITAIVTEKGVFTPPYHFS